MKRKSFKRFVAIVLAMVTVMGFSMNTFATEAEKVSLEIITVGDSSEIAEKEGSDSPSVMPASKKGISYITGDGVRLRASKGTSGTVLGLLYSGDKFYVTEPGTSWAYGYSYRHSRYGWVSTGYLTY